MIRSLRILAVVPCLAATALAGEPTKKTSHGPVSAIARKMTGVAGELGKARTGEAVQTREKAIVADLDELIAELERQCRAGMKRNNPNSGMRDSMISSGTGGIGDLVAPGDSAKDWAKLSGRERNRILQSMSEGFPPEYRLVLERFHRRLAEEKAAPSSGDSPQAPPKAEAPKAEKP